MFINHRLMNFSSSCTEQTFAKEKSRVKKADINFYLNSIFPMNHRSAFQISVGMNDSDRFLEFNALQTRVFLLARQDRTSLRS